MKCKNRSCVLPASGADGQCSYCRGLEERAVSNSQFDFRLGRIKKKRKYARTKDFLNATRTPRAVEIHAAQ